MNAGIVLHNVKEFKKSGIKKIIEMIWNNIWNAIWIWRKYDRKTI